ncbi:MAG: pseudouridine synthase [Euryarchaeota archaeon]|nr:pseudouridine synthase [Euryarchaeota archaeon]
MKILCTTELSLHRPEARRWRERMKLLEPLGDMVVVLPCSMRKPYSSSKSHRIFMKATKNVQELILTSPFGICPREMERTYPIQSYDVSTTGDWSQEEIDVVGRTLKEYIGGKSAIAHVAGGYRNVCEEYLRNCVYTCKNGKTTSRESIENLIKELKKYPKISKKERRLQTLRSIARYQFGCKDADSLIPDDSKVLGRFNKRIIYDGKQIATLLFDTGLYALNIEGGKILSDMGRNWVEIDFKLKTNTLFAPGVIDADSQIIPKDEVVILKDDEVVGVGKAVLNGLEMKEASKGVAVRIRHRKKA